MLSHLGKKTSAINKHIIDAHFDQQRPNFVMRAVKPARTVLERLTKEGVYIDNSEQETPRERVNGKMEGRRGSKMVRYAPQVRRV